MRALLVVNPKATTTSLRVRDVLAGALASETRLDLVETKRRGHATELAAEARHEGYDVVVALGGDGTVNEVVNGLLVDGPQPDGPVLGVVPGGSTNVFARALGLPDNAVEGTGELLRGLQEGRTRSIGLARADDHWFTFAAGLGLDAAVVRRVEDQRAAEGGRKATPALFVKHALDEFFRGTDRSTQPLELVVDGQDPVRLGLALVCNTDPWTYLGRRPVRPCPDASFDDGLDVFGLRRLGTTSTLRHLRQILARTPRPRGKRVVLVRDVPAVTVRADVPLPLQVDGDDLGDRTAVRFTAVARALRVVA